MKPMNGRAGIANILWATAQSWGGKIILFGIFLVLANILTPEQFGIASASGLIILLSGYVAELGFVDAIVQRPNLQPEEISAPFYLSLLFSLCLALLIFYLSDTLEAWARVEGLGAVLSVSCAIGPVMTLSVFQEAVYRRTLSFKQLAVRTLISNTAGGVIAIAAALAGFGVWSLVAQSASAAVISAVWLWLNPKWLPTKHIRLDSLRSLSVFGLNVLATRLLDFGVTRLVDFAVLANYGATGLGIYTVGSRIYQTMLMLLQGALSDVGLALLSRASSEKAAIRKTYQLTSVTSAFVGVPIFVCFAALSTEICSVLFGPEWQGVDKISQILLLLGAVQCVQFLNGTYLTSLGKPQLVSLQNLLRFIIVVPLILFWPAKSVGDIVLVFAVAQLFLSPISFVIVSRIVNVSLITTVRAVAPIYCSASIGFFACELCRPYIGESSPFLRGLMLAAIFALFYAASILIVARSQTRQVLSVFKNRSYSRSA